MGAVKFTGILKLSLDTAALAVVRELCASLPQNAKPLSEENLHVTLVHQNLLKPHKSLFVSATLPDGPSVVLDPVIRRVQRPDRTSWIALLENQRQMKEYIDEVCQMLGLTINEERVFHVSLANLSGSPFASVGDVKWDDITTSNTDV